MVQRHTASLACVRPGGEERNTKREVPAGCGDTYL